VLERDTLKTVAGRDSVDAAGKPIQEAHVRHILSAVEITQADVERARKLADRVRAEAAAKGADFGALAKRYSKYTGPHAEDGDIGLVSLGSMTPNVREGIDSLKIGEVSAVLVNKVGFNIFKVTDRKPERMYNLDEIKDELPDAVGQIQFRERYDAWIKTLRAKAQIDVRNI